MNITDSNKLIAEFMGLEYNKNLDIWYAVDGNSSIHEVKYHKSWDWLMPVIKKCLTEQAIGNIEKDWIERLECNWGYEWIKDINIAFNCTVKFIERYNKQKDENN